MKKKLRLLHFWTASIFIVLLSACKTSSSPEATLTPTRELPPPQVMTTSLPKAEAVSQEFLDAWRLEEYAAMYDLLNAESKRATSLEQFIQRFQDMAIEAALSEIEFQLGASEPIEIGVKVPYQVILRSAVLGDITRDTSMVLIQENGQWRIQWDDSLIMPDLAGGNYLSMDWDIPLRASILDRNGNPLAIQTDAVAIGVYPDYIDLKEKYAKGLLSLLSTVIGYRTDTIAQMIRDAPPGAYLALGEVLAGENPRQIQLLQEYGAVIARSYTSRFYYGNGVAPHVVGYVSAIQEGEIEAYRKRGYRKDEKVGRKGIELWGEEILAGKRGGTLYVFNPEGKLVSQVGSAPRVEGQDIFLTIDRDFQKEAQKALSVFNGAIVVLERDTGRVLAMVSKPSFDPNAYQTENYNWNTLINQILNDPDLPQFNRASQGQYPLGSVFKIVNMAAALESGRFTAETQYECGYVFDELPGFPRYDWTYEHFKEDGITQPSGLLTLPQGLIRSCNPFFWHIGLDLYRVGLTTAIADMSRGFGLGALTGIEGVDEEPGNVPVPQSEVDAINLAIGQGDSLVTPLQVARFVAAVGNGGTLYRPQLIERIVSKEGVVSFEFKPEAQGTLPIKPSTLAIIQEAMKGVVASEKPLGTAHRAFIGLDIPVAGKTGTATTSVGKPHAWFAGYTFAGRPDKPDIAIAVIAENAGEGADFAAPIFRRIVELYFFGRPLKVYRWEATFDVTRSPTPIVTDTPTPQPGLNP